MMLTTRARHLRSIAVAAMVILTPVLAPLPARAEIAQTAPAPWYQHANPETRQQAQDLFDQAVEKHKQLLRGEALELYEQALALWDNPDIRWNLALVLDDLGKYLLAHQQLASTLRWGAALGDERLRDVRERMRVLETQRLARIDARCDEPEADIKLDGQAWFHGTGRESTLVLPGTHYIGATRSGYFPVTVPVVVAAGERYRATLRMVLDHAVETRRWSAWPPWSVVALGAAVTAVAAGLEHQASVHGDAAAKQLKPYCMQVCDPADTSDIRRAATDHQRAIYAFSAGGSLVVAGLVLVWLNLPQVHRPVPIPSPVELVPEISSGGAAVSARLRF